MKKFNAFAFAVLAVCSAEAAVLKQVIVRQQWPWSTDVKIEYKLAEVTSPVDVKVAAFNGEVPLSADRLQAALSGDLYGITEDGVGTIILDPVKAFGTEKVALANFNVELTLEDSAANINEAVYKVFDLDTGACTDIRRSDLLGNKYGAYETDYAKIYPDMRRTPQAGDIIWTGVTNDIAYKTTKLVMRKIPAKDVVWTMGDSAAVRKAANVQPDGAWETNHLVRLTYDYWIGVFEVTRAQYGTMTGFHGMNVTAENADVLPEQKLVFGNYGANNANVAYFAGQMRKKTGLQGFDVPNEAEWEFACRAGTVHCLYTGYNPTDGWWSGTNGRVAPLAWISGNSGDAVHPVGLKLPNAFGLYDMLGNVRECTRDLRGGSSAEYFATFGAGWTPETVVVDPPSPTGGYHLYKGGSYKSTGAYVRAGDRTMARQNWTTSNGEEGMRVMLRLAE